MSTSFEQLTPYQQRLYEYVDQAVSQLPAGSSNESIQKYAEQLLNSANDHYMCQELEKAKEDISEDLDSLAVLHGEHQESKVEDQIEQIRQSI